MCRYCEMQADGDIPEDKQELIEVEEPMGQASIELQVIVVNNKLCAGVYAGMAEIIQHEVEINYCPFCGEKL